MTEAIKLFSFLNVIFILLLALSGSFSGLISEGIYYLAFIIPIAIGFGYSKTLQREREEIKGVAEPPERLFGFDGKRALKLLPLIAPTILFILLTSVITSAVLSFFGVTSSVVEDVGIVRMLLIHALIPAVLEELLFRYIPLKLLLPYSKRWCVIYSALCFSLIHCSFSSMPYAFIAGIIFMTFDVIFESVWPSIILHLLNNATSVVFMKYCSGTASSLAFVFVLVILALVSLVFVNGRREEYGKDVLSAFEKGEGSTVIYAPLILVVICFYIAWSNL